jgi:hypothetical protein
MHTILDNTINFDEFSRKYYGSFKIRIPRLLAVVYLTTLSVAQVI